MSRHAHGTRRRPEDRSDAELVEDTTEDAPVENAADHTIAEAMIEAAPEDRARRRKRQTRERR